MAAFPVSNNLFNKSFIDKINSEAFEFRGVLYPLGSAGSTTWTRAFGSLVFSGQTYNTSFPSQNTIMSVTPEGGRLFYFSEINITPDVDVYVLVNHGTLVGRRYKILANTILTLKDIVVTSSTLYSIVLTSLTPGVAIPATATIRVDAYGRDMSDDSTPSTEVILTVGDSITYGTKTTHRADTWPWMLRNYYASQDRVMRVVNMGEPGISSAGIYGTMITGKYDVANIKVITYMTGANDPNTLSNVEGGVAGGLLTSQAQANYINNVKAMLDFRKNFCPDSVIFILGTPPIGVGYPTANHEENMVIIRNKARQAVIEWIDTNGADPKIKFIDFGGSTPEWTTPVFDRTDAANYGGDAIHPIKKGTTKMAERIINVIKVENL